LPISNNMESKMKNANRSTVSQSRKTIAPVGLAKNLPLKNPPKSGWKKASDWQTWKSQLPNAYTYRLRVTDSKGVPIPIVRVRGNDQCGLLYIGETGIKNNDQSYRGEKLAHGVTDQVVGIAVGAHGGAKKFWTDGWHARLLAINPSYLLEFGWDEHEEEVNFAAKDERLPESQQKNQVITNSGKGLAMHMEDALIHDYEQNYKELPPLNSAKSPGLRDRDRKTKRDVSQDVKDIV